jgi:hypothetical protein
MFTSHLHHLKTVRPRPRRLWWAVAAASVALVAAGCGSSSPTSSTASTGAGPKNGASSAYKFSACMRDHGVTNFPDPVVHSSDGQTSVGIQIAPSQASSPQFKTAQKACQGILPTPKGGSTQVSSGPSTQALVELARCLRGHGYPRFPDPDGQGQLSFEMISAAGIDMQAPGFLQTAQGCASATHGQITAAMVAQAVRHSEGGQ